MSLQPSGNLNR